CVSTWSSFCSFSLRSETRISQSGELPSGREERDRMWHSPKQYLQTAMPIRSVLISSILIIDRTHLVDTVPLSGSTNYDNE
ncbi:hypothetical protein PFISCL1PPCAC_25154, partial [Pristionchus fissidentatus]